MVKLAIETLGPYMKRGSFSETPTYSRIMGPFSIVTDTRGNTPYYAVNNAVFCHDMIVP